MDKKKRALSHRKADDKLSRAIREEDKLRVSFGIKDYLTVAAESLGVSALVSFGFYDSLKGLIVLLPIGILNLSRYYTARNKKREEAIRSEFKEILLSVASSVRTGYSVENAFRDVGDVLENMYGDRSVLAEDIEELNRQIDMRIPVEKAFFDMAKKYPLEEIESFSEIFLYTKRLGGGYAKNLNDTADRLEERITLRSELDTMIAQKKLELMIMSVMPIAIIVYMRISSGDFLTPLYHNIPGVILMSVCLVLYAASIAIGDHIITRVMKRL